MPAPVPSEVLSSLIVGFLFVPQQTPRSDITAPPSEVIFPPLTAEFNVIPVTSEVVRVGLCGRSHEFNKINGIVEHKLKSRIKVFILV